MNREESLIIARSLYEAGEVDKSYELCEKWLTQDPNDGPFLTLMCNVLVKGQKVPIAYQIAKRLVQMEPRMAGAWVNLGMIANELWQEAEAERAYKRALKYCGKPKTRYMILVNIAAMMIDCGRFKDAEQYCKQALEIEDEEIENHGKAYANLGFCQLAQRNWTEGWKNYHLTLGHSDWRDAYEYGDAVAFSEGDRVVSTIVVHGEQGIGDELSFASMVPDAIDTFDKVILDVDPRLANLFRRSFPKAKVYGTRNQACLKWDKDDMSPDYVLPIGQLGEFFRQTDEDFPGTPYLVPDPDRQLMWQALFNNKDKPVIGIAWQGGIARTGARYRRWDLEQLLPILTGIDAHFVSLQYKPSGREIEKFLVDHDVDLVEYPHATLTQDYDDTASMVAALDMVICMQTAVGHLAGALGVPAWVFVPNNSQWRYGTDEYTDMIWYNSVRLWRQSIRGDWTTEINQAAEELRAYIRELQEGAATAA